MRDITDGGDFYFAADVLNQHRNFPRGTVVLGTTGCEVTSDGTDMTLDVQAGEVAIEDITQSISSTTVTLDTADDNIDRYDLVVVEDNAGTYEVTSVTGTVEKVTPTLQPDQVLLAVVFVEANSPSVASGNVNDARILSTSTDNDGSFNTLQVLESPSAAEDVARKAELDTKSDNGHDHTGERLYPFSVETDTFVFTGEGLEIGLNSNVDGDLEGPLALGMNASATSKSTTAVGHNTDATSFDATALGVGAKANGSSSIAVGSGSKSNGTSGISIGQSTSALERRAVAIGQGAEVESGAGVDSLAIGYNSSVVNVNGGDNAAVGSGAKVDDASFGAAFGPLAAVTSGTGGVALGMESEAGGEDAAVGRGAIATGGSSVAAGRDSQALNSGAVAIGRESLAGENNSVAIGSFANPRTAGTAHLSVDQLRFGAIKNTIPDSELETEEMTIDADEANGQFQIRYKDSSGNMQTGTLTFD